MKTFILIFLLMLMNTHAKSQETSYHFKTTKYSVKYELKNNLQTVWLGGELYSGIFNDLTGLEKIKSLLRPNINTIVFLRSGGGYVKLFDELKTALKQACNSDETSCEITTVVHDTCRSACVPLFMVGDVRKANRKKASFGFHQMALLPGIFSMPGEMQKILVESGVDSSWVNQHQPMFESLEMTLFTPEELEGSHIITDLYDNLPF